MHHAWPELSDLFLAAVLGVTPASAVQRHDPTRGVLGHRGVDGGDPRRGRRRRRGVARRGVGAERRESQHCCGQGAHSRGLDGPQVRASTLTDETGNLTGTTAGRQSRRVLSHPPSRRPRLRRGDLTARLGFRHHCDPSATSDRGHRVQRFEQGPQVGSLDLP